MSAMLKASASRLENYTYFEHVELKVKDYSAVILVVPFLNMALEDDDQDDEGPTALSTV